MEDNCQFEVNLRWSGGPGARISAAGISPDIGVTVPFTKDTRQAGLWSPEHLLLGAVTSDFTTEYLALAQKAGIELGDFTCNAYGCTDVAGGGGGGSLCDIIVKPYILVALPKQVEKALRLVEAAHQRSITISTLKTRVHIMPHITCENDKC